MQGEIVEVRENNSVRLDDSGIILSLRHTSGRECEATVGYPGLPNQRCKLSTGDALLFETPVSGMFEIRVFTQNAVSATFLVTRISPRHGLAGAFVTTSPDNSPFATEEIERITASLEQVKQKLSADAVLLPEQFRILAKRLDEIGHASNRLGRKDWINYAAGALTSVCASAAFAPSVTREIFTAMNEAFAWFFGNALHLLN